MKVSRGLTRVSSLLLLCVMAHTVVARAANTADLMDGYLGLTPSQGAALQHRQLLCNNGLISSAPWLPTNAATTTTSANASSVATDMVACVCLPGYLPPDCLYTKEQSVPLGISWRWEAAADGTSLSSSAAGRVPVPPTDEEIAAALGAHVGGTQAAWDMVYSASKAVAPDGHYVYAMVRASGKYAQQLLAHVDASENAWNPQSADSQEEAAGASVVMDAICIADTTTTGYSSRVFACGFWRLVDAQVLLRGPAVPPAPLYWNSWMRLYFSAANPSYYVSLPMCGWALGALVFMVALGLYESCGGASASRGRRRRDRGKERCPSPPRTQREAASVATVRSVHEGKTTTGGAHRRGRSLLPFSLSRDRASRRAESQATAAARSASRQHPRLPPSPSGPRGVSASLPMARVLSPSMPRGPSVDGVPILDRDPSHTVRHRARSENRRAPHATAVVLDAAPYSSAFLPSGGVSVRPQGVRQDRPPSQYYPIDRNTSTRSESVPLEVRGPSRSRSPQPHKPSRREASTPRQPTSSPSRPQHK